MAKWRILVVDDEQGMLEVCASTLRKLPDTETVLERDSRRAAERLGQENFDLLISDVRMPGLGGVELLRIARQRDPNLAALMLTAFPTVETAVESMKLGAADYITKPFLPPDLLTAARRLLEQKCLREENQSLRRQVERPYAFGEILGQSPVIATLRETIQQVAVTNFDVLIIGETGTGKELVARAIHQGSSRKSGPFVPVDCGAIPEDLMEREFFGHERGAFTGANARSIGLMEFADKGTFFLDEIGQLPLQLQARLLRALQERRIRRVGGTKEIEVDVRVLAATTLNLEEEVREQRFRLDLYHRINVARITLPPLRERGEDVLLLARHLLGHYAAELGKGNLQLTPEAEEVLTHYPWPGNVRELQNVLKRTLATMRSQMVSVEDLPEEIVAASSSPSGAEGGYLSLRDRRLAAFEKDYFRNLLIACHGDIPAAAREAHLTRGSLYRFLKRHGLNPADFRA